MRDIYFLTDLHGQLQLFYALRDWCYAQDPQCTIIYGGDAADRGKQGYKIMEELLNDPQIVYLYGNHEDLFVRAADAIISAYKANKEYLSNCNTVRATDIIRHMRTIQDSDVLLHLTNGGDSTLTDWLCSGADINFINKIRALPRTFSYENIDFCHAGGVYTAFNTIKQQEDHGEKLDPKEEEYCIWDRNCIALGWETGRICIHGHTPTICLPRGIYGRDKSLMNIHPCSWYDRMGAKYKRGGMKIDMDTATAYSGRAYVLNCLTGVATGFYDPNVSDDNLKNLPITRLEDYKIKLGE